MASATPNYQYLNLDFASQKQALIQRIKSRYPGVYNDFFAGSLGILLINVVAWAMSTLAYTLNRIGGENYIPTMTLRESAVRLGNLTGYQLSNPFPATVYCNAVLTSVPAADVTLTAGTPVRTSDSAALTFQLANNYTIPAGQTYPQTTVLTFDPNQSGASIVQALLSLTNGSLNADCLDTTVDLRQYVLQGQLLSTDSGVTTYLVDEISQSPGATGYNRLILDTPWAAATLNTTANVYERRVAFTQGQTQQDQFNPTTGAAFIGMLSGSPVIDGSITVTVNGQTWTEGNLATADSDALVFQSKTLPTGSTLVMFGDGSLGAAPQNGGTIIATYLVGGGIAGNVAVGAINTTITGIIASLSSPVTVQVTNGQAGSGGADAESLGDARVAIPASTQANGRAVTLSDYSTIATSYVSTLGQVKFANAQTRAQTSPLESNLVLVYAWTTAGDGSLTPVAGLLKSNLQTYLQSVAVGTDYVLLADGATQPMPLACRVKVAAGYDVPTVSEDVTDTINSYVDALAPGQPAVYSDLLTTIAGVEGVAQASLAAPSDDLILPNADTALVPPSDVYQYQVTLQSTASGVFTGQLTYVPRAAWALAATLGGQALTVSPDVTAGYVNFTGQGLDPAQDSNLNLTTGQVTLRTLGAVGDLLFTYTQVSAYATDRQTNLYASYTGDQSQATRRAVRAALRSWAEGFAVGATLYAYPPSVANPATSVYDVIAAVTNVGTVAQINLDTATGTAQQLNVDSQTLIKLSQVVLNGSAD